MNHRARSHMLKFWCTSNKDEQLRRFNEREDTGYKRYKITEEITETGKNGRLRGGGE